MPEKTTLRSILHNKTKGALSRSVFFAYLKQFFAENVLEFWVVVQDFYNMYEPENERSTYSVFNIEPPKVNMTPERMHEKMAEMRLICLTYISDDSPLQININDTYRLAIMDHYEDTPVPDGLFNDAQAEAEELLETNYFFKFMKFGQLKTHKSSPLGRAHLSLRLAATPLAMEDNSSSQAGNRASVKIQSQFEQVIFDEGGEVDEKLDSILHLKTKGIMSRSALHGFLEHRGAGPLLEFWVEVLNFYNAYEPANPTSSFVYYSVSIPEDSEESPAEKMQEINKIFEKYLSHRAERRVILSPDILHGIDQKLAASSDKDPPTNVFDEAQRAVQKRMEREHLQEFLADAQRKKDRQSVVYVPRPPPPKPPVPRRSQMAQPPPKKPARKKKLSFNKGKGKMKEKARDRAQLKAVI